MCFVCTYSHGINQGHTAIISAVSLNYNIFCSIEWPTSYNLKQGIGKYWFTDGHKFMCRCIHSCKHGTEQIMLGPTCDDILPTSRTVYVTSTVWLLKVAREACTNSSAMVSFRGRRIWQPTHKSSLDSICDQTRHMQALVCRVTLVWDVLNVCGWLCSYG